TMAAVAVLVFEYEPALPAWLTTLGFVCAAVGGAVLVAATPTALAATRVQVTAHGTADDVFADLGPLVPPALRGRPWPFARAVGGLLVLAVAAAGAVQSDPIDGA